MGSSSLAVVLLAVGVVRCVSYSYYVAPPRGLDRQAPHIYAVIFIDRHYCCEEGATVIALLQYVAVVAKPTAFIGFFAMISDTDWIAAIVATPSCASGSKDGDGILRMVVSLTSMLSSS